jgi:excisionase family DNA binding protein
MPSTKDDVPTKALSCKEACQLLKVSLSTLRRAISGKQIKVFRIGRALRIPIQEIERFGQNDDTVGLKNAAQLLNVNYETVRRAVKAGNIHAIRITPTGPYRIHMTEINRIIGESLTSQVQRSISGLHPAFNQSLYIRNSDFTCKFCTFSAH